jgi:hypothetical protein
MAPPLTYPLDGPMVLLGVRVPASDADALVELARRKHMKRPELVREMMRWALDRWAAEAELADTGPPSQGG